MNHFKLLQELTSNLNEANTQPLKTQSEVEALKKQVALLNKAVIGILNTLPSEQLEKIKSIGNGNN